MSRLKNLLFPILAFMLAACQYDPFAHRFLTREPSADEVVGTYILDEVYVDMVEDGLSEKIRGENPKPTITLRSDGSAQLKSFPVFNESKEEFDYDFKGFEDIETRWEICSVGGVSSGGDDSTKVYGLSFGFPESKGFFRWPTFTGDKTVDGMIFTLYDGDQGQILGYQKSEGE